MNIVFFGSAHFGEPSLKALLANGHKISCVVTQPDKQKGRGLALGETVIKSTAKSLGLRIYQPDQINSNETVKFLKNLQADLFVVIAYGQILPQDVLDIPKIFSINIHASLLPKYRGAAPINWAIIKGDKTTGITVIKMTQEMDAGPIILQKAADIHDEDTAVTLENRLSDIAAALLLNAVESLQKKNYNLIPQNEEKVSFAFKLKKEDGLIRWENPAQEIYNLIRGCLYWPGAFTYYKGKILKIFKVKAFPLEDQPTNLLPGEIIDVSRDGISVATGKNNLIIEELQIEGKRKMPAEEFISGHKISSGEKLGKK